MTSFRKSQARHVLEAQLRALAPHMTAPDALREVVEELARDGVLWAHLQRPRITLTPPLMGAPVR